MELTPLSTREVLRLQTAQQVLDKALSLAEAAKALGLSTRQVKRLVRRLRIDGAAGFASPRRGRPPNNAFDAAARERVLDLARSAYAGFGPTFLAEKLAEREKLQINRETLRQWLIAAQLHRPRRRRDKPRPMRERRPRVGELVQADGSPHHWFEDRGDPCTLLLYVDDATTRILGAHFAEQETTNDYFTLFEEAFERHGLPVSIYTDKHGVFRINRLDVGDQETQMQRALRELGIELICANSPQAKGRVERANRTLQDRLVKEFRLANISTIGQANRALPEYIRAFNEHFAVAPSNNEDAHRSSAGIALGDILAKKYERVLTAARTFQIDDRVYAIDPSSAHRLRKGMRVNIVLPRTGEPFVLYKGARIVPRYLGALQRRAKIVESKRLNDHVDRHIPDPRKAHKPAASHPWHAAARLALAERARGHL